MTRKLTGKAHIVALFGALIAPAALAQMTSSARTARQPSATAETSLSAHALRRPLLPGALSTQAAPGSPGQRKKSGGVPFSPGSSLFLPVVTYTFPGVTFPDSIAVADLNGDGKLDLAISNPCHNPGNCQPDGFVAVLLGNGDGTFVQGQIYDSGGANASLVAVADLNRDGKPDLVVMNNGQLVGPSGVGVLLGNGDGTFQPVVTYGVGSNWPWALAVGDVNGDGIPDIVLSICATFCDPHGSLAIMFGNGDGTFQPMASFDVSTTAASSLALGDVNGDGHADILVTVCLTSPCSGKSAVDVLLGNGDGTFRPAASYASGYGFGQGPVVIADVNGDGTPDVAVASCLSSTCLEGAVDVLLGNGDGTFQPVTTYDSGGHAPSLAIADVNGDGKPDLVVGDCSGTPGVCGGAIPGAVGVLLGNGDGTFQSVISYYSGGNSLSSVAVADLNGDGRPDVVAGNNWPGSIGVLLNNGSSCTTAPLVTLSTNPRDLWPPNSNMIPVTVSGTITDTGCTITRTAYSVTDEYGQVQPSGAVTLSAEGAYSFTVLLQASRLGTDLDGRLYTITVSASNNAGKTGSQGGRVIVPHDQGH